MKINNNMPITPIEQGEAHRKPNAAGKGFEELLAGELQTGQTLPGGAAATAGTSTTASALALLIQAQESQAGSENVADTQLADFVAGRVEGLLDSLDGYAASMAATGSQSLRSMYGMLEAMTGEVDALKSALPSLGAEHAGLASMVNELDVLTTAERIKFNRGDYL